MRKELMALGIISSENALHPAESDNHGQAGIAAARNTASLVVSTQPTAFEISSLDSSQGHPLVAPIPLTVSATPRTKRGSRLRFRCIDYVT